MAVAPRAVVVHRATPLEELVARHGTRGQAEFFLRSRGRTLDEVQGQHDRVQAALREVAGAIPLDWRRAGVERADLAGFPFGPQDVVVVVGQDGLVANVAKYLDAQPVLGVDPEPGVNPGVLVRHRPGDVRRLLSRLAEGAAVPMRRLTMAQAVTDDGQQLRALNEVFLGPATHQTARYVLSGPQGRQERQASSGVLAGTGTGATGWLASVHQATGGGFRLPDPSDPVLAWFVREAWPSPSTGASLTAGLVGGPGALADAEVLSLRIESDSLVVFGDGIESDRLVVSWGQTVRIGVAPSTLALIG